MRNAYKYKIMYTNLYLYIYIYIYFFDNNLAVLIKHYLYISNYIDYRNFQNTRKKFIVGKQKIKCKLFHGIKKKNHKK